VTLELLWRMAVFIAGGCVSAGIFIGVVRQMRKDLNGVGGARWRDAEKANYRFLTHVVVVLTYTESKEDRIQIGKRFLEDGGR
jgi:hypothetical protein